MAAPVIYRSTDTGAPILTGNCGSAKALLDACLVTGYGSTRATATLTSSGVNVSNNDTVTINGTVYTFKTALTPAANEILIGGSAAASLSNLCAAIGQWGTSGTTYGASTVQQSALQATGLTATVITFTAFVGGTGGNSLTLAKSAATLTVSGATFSGGAGSDTTASLGWGTPYTGTNKAVYRSAAGVRHYLDVDDSAPNTTGLGRSFFIRGYEVMTAVATGTGLFPTVAQVTSAVALVKSTTLAVTARPWLLIGDDRTFYLFVESAGTDPPVLGSHTWSSSFFFGEILSGLSGDLYRTIIGYQSVTATVAVAGLTVFSGPTLASQTNACNQNMARTSSGAGTSAWVASIGNIFTSPAMTDGLLPYPNPTDGGYAIAAVDVFGRSNGATALAANNAASDGIRGRLRGFYCSPYTGTGIDDQTTFSGVGDFAGKTFVSLKMANPGTIVFETTAWTASA